MELQDDPAYGEMILIISVYFRDQQQRDESDSILERLTKLNSAINVLYGCVCHRIAGHRYTKQVPARLDYLMRHGLLPQDATQAQIEVLYILE